MDIPEEIAAAMQVQIDMWVSYVFRTSRKKETRGDAAVGLVVRQSAEAIAPDGITRGMINAVRTYLAKQHQVKHGDVTIINVVRLIPEVVDVPEKDDMGAVHGEHDPGPEDESDNGGVPVHPEDDSDERGESESEG